MVKRPEVISLYQTVVNTINPEFSHIEQLKSLHWWRINGLSLKKMEPKGELTPTLKLKRRKLKRKNTKSDRSMYAEE